MMDHEACADYVIRTGRADEYCLKRAVPHILHDLDLLELAWSNSGLRIGWTLWFITVRVLMNFFFTYERTKKKGKYCDDVLASDYIKSGSWKSIADDLKTHEPPDYAAVRETANKLAAHLTYTRADQAVSGSTAPSAATHEYIIGVAAVWLESLEPERRVWFGRGLPSGPRAV